MSALRIAAAVALLATTTAADEPAPAPLPPDLAETLRWFPADIDALVVTSDFKLADAEANWDADPQQRDAWLAQDPVPRIFRAQATGRVHRKTDGGSNDPSPAARERRERAYVERIDQFWGVLAERQVQFAVLGAREVFPASNFGFCGYAGCHVVRFVQPLGPDAAPLAEKLRATADRVIKVRDREVAAFNWSFPKEPYLKARPWEGLFFVIPRDDDRELLIATQRQLLEEILARRANPAAQRAALPMELLEWQFVDTSAPVWGMLAKPRDDDPPAAAARDVITFEYHTGDAARFVLRAPSQSLPDDPKKIDTYAKDSPPTAALFLHGLYKFEVDYNLARPAGEPAQVSVPFTGDAQAIAQRGVAFVFLTGAFFQHCLDPATYGN